MKGIDVSRWNGTINWARVAESGIEFAMLRAGTGRSCGGFTEDPMFEANLSGATAVGIPCGVYLFSYAKSVEAAKVEAEKLAAFLLPHKGSISWPVAYDIENANQASLGKAVCTKMANEFCDIIRAAGFTPMVYANKNWLLNHLNAADLTADVWLAHYTTRTDYAGNHMIWQYTDKGMVNGISGNVDIDIAYTDYSAKASAENATETAITKLAAAGEMNSPDYWRAVVAGKQTASAENIAALLRKWADKV